MPPYVKCAWGGDIRDVILTRPCNHWTGLPKHSILSHYLPIALAGVLAFSLWETRWLSPPKRHTTPLSQRDVWDSYNRTASRRQHQERERDG